MTPDRQTDAVRSTLATVGIAGAALALTAAAAVPAFAAGPGGATGQQSRSEHAHSQSGTQHKDSDDGSTDATDTDQSQAAGQQDDADEQQPQGSQPTADHGQSTSHAHQTTGQSSTHSSPGSAPSTGGANTATGHNPPGNNGTVKIHDDANDPTHANQPHVSCDFYVDVWGFDAAQSLTLSFAGQAPTGPGVPLTLTPTSGSNPMVSTTDAGGGNDFDGETGFAPTAADLAALGTPHPQQGYHVKLTVDTGQPVQSGGGHKYKVFWLQPCPAAPTTPTQVGGVSENGGTTPTGPVTETGNATGVGGLSSGGTVSAATPPRVLGERLTRGTTPAAAAPAAATSGALPFTGSEIAAVAAAGAVALGAGAALTVAGRRRRAAHHLG